MITFDTISISFFSPRKAHFKKVFEEKMSCIRQYGISSLFFEKSSISIRTQILDKKLNGYYMTEYDSEGKLIVSKDVNNRNIVQKSRQFFKHPSYSYDVNIKTEGDYYSLEFSIPKYLYGHNINMFPVREDLKSLPDIIQSSIIRKIEMNKLHTGEFEYYCLINFFEKFFYNVFGVPLKEVNPRVNRIDLSFNYRFSSSDAKKDFLKLLQRRFYNLSSNFVNYNNQTFSKVTQKYSIKIYDKEEEFSVHDRKELFDYFSKQYSNEDAVNKQVNNIEAHSKNVLRAEISLRDTQLHYLFFKNYDLFNFPNKSQYKANYQYYRALTLCHRALSTFYKWFSYDYSKNEIDLSSLDDRKKQSIKNFLEKFDYVLSKTVRECTVEMFCTFLYTHYSPSAPLSSKFFNPGAWDKYKFNCEVEKDVHFYLLQRSFSKQQYLSPLLLSLGFEELQNYVEIVSRSIVDDEKLTYYIRRNKKSIQKKFGFNPTFLNDFILAKNSSPDVRYYGYGKTSYYKHLKHYEQMIDYFGEDKLKAKQIEKFSFSLDNWQNTKYTSSYAYKQLNEKKSIYYDVESFSSDYRKLCQTFTIFLHTNFLDNADDKRRFNDNFDIVLDNFEHWLTLHSEDVTLSDYTFEEISSLRYLFK